MNVSPKILISVLLAAVLPLAASVSHAHDSLTVTCARPHLPSQQAVGALLGLNNFGQVYSARERLMQDIHRACRKGTRRIILSGDAATTVPTGGSQGEFQAAMMTSSISASPAH